MGELLGWVACIRTRSIAIWQDLEGDITADKSWGWHREWQDGNE